MIEPLRILHVEDHELNRLLVRAALLRAQDPILAGASLFEADTLSEARAILARERVDLVLLDIRLPDGSGLELSGEIARRPVADRPGVIAVSASVLAAERAVALESGVDAFMGKPYAPRDLLALMSRMVAERTRGKGSADRNAEAG